MKKAMLSQPMVGKTDEEIAATREKAINVLEEKGFNYILVSRAGRDGQKILHKKEDILNDPEMKNYYALGNYIKAMINSPGGYRKLYKVIKTNSITQNIIFIDFE